MSDTTTESVVRVSGPINAAGLEMTLETGRFANLADGAVVVRVGDTTVLSTVCTSKPREGIDFFPLTVDVEERAYAAGKIPGSFFRREGRPGEHAILTARLTDRPLRPSFPSDFRNEVQVIATVLGVDLENPHDVASINGASAALTVSGIPFNGPIGAVRLAHHNGELDRAPDLPRRRRGDVRDRRRRPQARRRRRRDHDGRGRRHRALVEALRGRRAEGHRGDDRRRARRVEAVDRGVDRPADPAPRGRTRRRTARSSRSSTCPRVDYSPEIYAAVKQHAETTTAAAMGIADKTERNAQLAEIEAGFLAAPRRHRRRAGSLPRRGGRGEARVPLVAEGSDAQPHRQRRRSHRRSRSGRHPAAVGRGRHRADRARHRPVPAGRDAGAVGPDARHAAHGADARHDHAGREEALHAPLQLPAVLHGRDGKSGFAEAA